MARKRKNPLEELETKAEKIVETAKESVKEVKDTKLLTKSYAWWLYSRHRRFFKSNGINAGRIEGYLQQKGFVLNAQLSEFCHRLNGGLSGVNVELFELAGREFINIKSSPETAKLITIDDAVKNILDVVGEVRPNKVYQSACGIAHDLLKKGIAPIFIVNLISETMRRGYGITEYDAIIFLLRERKVWDFSREAVWEELDNDY